jgi:hypothetical protein
MVDIQDIEIISTYFGTSLGISKECAIHTAVARGYSLTDVVENLKKMISEAKGKVETYSDKAIVVRKESIKDSDIPGLLEIGKELRSGITLNQYLTGGPGYIFPKYLKPKVQAYLLFGVPELEVTESRDYVRKSGMYDKLRGIFGLTGKLISGIDARIAIKKAILPHPIDSAIYADMIMAIDPEKEYRQIEVLSLEYDLFHSREPKKPGELDIHVFVPHKLPKIVYWVTGPEDKVKEYIADTEEEHPYQSFVSKLYPSKTEGGDVAAWMEHWTTD